MRSAKSLFAKRGAGPASGFDSGRLHCNGAGGRFWVTVFALALGSGALCAQSDYATPYTFTLLAGSPLSGDVDDVGANARFSNPTGLTVASSGDIFVSDSNNGSVRKISASGAVSTLARIPILTGATFFSWPAGVAVDISGNVYVACSGNHQIAKITPAGTVTVFAGNPTRNPDLPTFPGILGPTADPSNRGYTDGAASIARFNSPSGLVFDNLGNLYVCDVTNRAIRKITPAGMVSTVAGGTNYQGISPDGAGSIAFLGGISNIAIAPDGTIYGADSQLNTIRKITPDGS